MSDPMTTETAEMFLRRAERAEAERDRIREKAEGAVRAGGAALRRAKVAEADLAAFLRGDAALVFAEYVRARQGAEAERDAYKTALRILADPENWSGDPEAHGAVLRGHLTPYELAVEVLAGLSSTTEE